MLGTQQGRRVGGFRIKLLKIVSWLTVELVLSSQSLQPTASRVTETSPEVTSGHRTCRVEIHHARALLVRWKT